MNVKRLKHILMIVWYWFWIHRIGMPIPYVVLCHSTEESQICMILIWQSHITIACISHSLTVRDGIMSPAEYWSRHMSALTIINRRLSIPSNVQFSLIRDAHSTRYCMRSWQWKLYSGQRRSCLNDECVITNINIKDARVFSSQSIICTSLTRKTI